MTAITTLLTNNYIAVGSDSMITRVIDGTRTVTKVNEPKFVYYQKLNCVAIYWGLAQVFENNVMTWTTIGWLKKWVKEQEKFEKTEDFVKAMSSELRNVIQSGIGQKVSSDDRGIGIHVAGFENIDNNVIPELFLISNFKDVLYKDFGEISWSRRTAVDFIPDHKTMGFNQQKKELSDRLKQGELFYFNNGDPFLFNQFAGAVLNSVSMTRNLFFKERDEKTILRQMASYPIELTKKFQKTHYHKNEIKIGGRVYNLLFSKEGTIE